MEALIIIAMITIISGQNVLRKIYNGKTDGQGTYLFLGILSLTAALFFLFSSRFDLTFLPEVMIYSVFIAITYSMANYYSIKAIAIGPLSLSALIGAFSLVIPTTFGILFYEEAVTVGYGIGVIFLVLSIFLTNSKSEKSEVKITFKWALFSVIGAVTNGLFSVVQSLQQRAFDGQYKSELMIVGLFLSSLFFFAMSFIKEREVLKKCVRHSWVAAIVGASSGIGNLLKMMLMALMNLSIIFPLINAGGIIATAIVAILCYKEKLTQKQYAGVFCGIITIVFISI